MKSWENTPLNERERTAVEEAVRFLMMNYPIERVILFGSKARGDYDEYSDIDLLLISVRPMNWREEKKITEDLFDIGMEYDVIFGPLFVSLAGWEGGIFIEFPVYKEILRDGVTIP